MNGQNYQASDNRNYYRGLNSTSDAAPDTYNNIENQQGSFAANIPSNNAQNPQSTGFSDQSVGQMQGYGPASSRSSVLSYYQTPMMNNYYQGMGRGSAMGAAVLSPYYTGWPLQSPIIAE